MIMRSWDNGKWIRVNVPDEHYEAARNGRRGVMAENYAKTEDGDGLGIWDPTIMDPDLNSKLKPGASMDEVYGAERDYAARTGISVGDIGKEEAAKYRAAHIEVFTQEIGFSVPVGALPADSNPFKQAPETNSFNQVPRNDLYGMLQSILKVFNQFLSQNSSFRPF